MRTLIILGAINGFLAVAFGAFAAHALDGVISVRLIEIFQTGVDYQALHAVALLVTGLLARLERALSNALRLAGWAFTIGIVLFSGSLYLLALTDTPWLGAITPVGGTAFLLGWLTLAWHAWRT
jgi:uncharacterized membrane protein YgdD (TMEM256/DUF423 family)